MSVLVQDRWMLDWDGYFSLEYRERRMEMAGYRIPLRELQERKKRLERKIEKATCDMSYSVDMICNDRGARYRRDQECMDILCDKHAQVCAQIKEWKAPESDFPAWGDLGRRAAAWELAGAISLLYAGAALLILYHPEAVMAPRRAIDRLMDVVD